MKFVEQNMKYAYHKMMKEGKNMFDEALKKWAEEWAEEMSQSIL